MPSRLCPSGPWEGAAITVGDGRLLRIGFDAAPGPGGAGRDDLGATCSAHAGGSPACGRRPARAHAGLDDPYKRLERTAEVMNAVGFGSREEADRVTQPRPRDAPKAARRARSRRRAVPSRDPLRGRRSRPADVGAVQPRRLRDRGLRAVRQDDADGGEGGLLAGLPGGRRACSASPIRRCPPTSRSSTPTATTCMRAAISSSPTGRSRTRARSCSSHPCRCASGRSWRPSTSSRLRCCRGDPLAVRLLVPAAGSGARGGGPRLRRVRQAGGAAVRADDMRRMPVARTA